MVTESQAKRLDRLTVRLHIQNRVLKRLLLEVVDDPNRHLHRCQCGRCETRYEMCCVCYGEQLKRELLG